MAALNRGRKMVRGRMVMSLLSFEVQSKTDKQPWMKSQPEGGAVSLRRAQRPVPCLPIPDSLQFTVYSLRFRDLGA